MKYEYLNHSTHSETPVDENGDYTAIITIQIKCTDDIGPVFSKDIMVTNNNSQTGYEVDTLRQLSIDNYIASINQ